MLVKSYSDCQIVITGATKYCINRPMMNSSSIVIKEEDDEEMEEEPLNPVIIEPLSEFN